MAIRAKKSEGSGTVAPALEPGTYPARLVQIIVLGTQPQRPYQGQPRDPAEDIMLTYELADEFLQDEDGNDIEDKPRWVSETIRFSDSDKAHCAKRYKAFDPNKEDDGDWELQIGKPCMVTLNQYQSGKPGEKVTRNGVVSAVAMRKKDADKAPPLVNDPKVFNIYEPDEEILKSLPQWLQDKIRLAPEFSGEKNSEVSGDEENGNASDDEPPFEPDTEEEAGDDGDW